jgi:hypothetical protein
MKNKKKKTPQSLVFASFFKFSSLLNIKFFIMINICLNKYNSGKEVNYNGGRKKFKTGQLTLYFMSWQ